LGVLRSGGTFIYSLEQILRVRAEVCQVSRYYYVGTSSAREIQVITVGLQKVVQQFQKSFIAYLRSVYKVYQLPHKEKSTGMA
jgi:hypothetical protein